MAAPPSCESIAESGPGSSPNTATDEEEGPGVEGGAGESGAADEEEEADDDRGAGDRDAAEAQRLRDEAIALLIHGPFRSVDGCGWMYDPMLRNGFSACTKRADTRLESICKY